MIAVIFEVWPAADQRGTYLDLASALKEELAEVDGFVSVERYESLAEPGKLLSLSFWQDETAIAAWRNGRSHRATQASGRSGVFRDYRLRVAHVARDYGLRDRNEAPTDSKAAHG